ncbi:hypothetical protein DFH09DRAFT_1283512 [Mycena vulgaris]|nr:hypothetical protein DFH09DRAFT_1283509 [Mycena vulgaris]KAJ6537499.1 hypothetical protein DFH09DRAFT_1283512 [Mycena vulgaris]
MTPPKTAPPRAPATQSKTDKLADAATTSLEVALKILGLLTDVMENVPYINAITGCIQKLIDIRKAIGANKKRAEDLLDNIGEVSRVVAEGLRDLDDDRRSIAAQGLSTDLNRYQMVLSESCTILMEWTSQNRVKRFWKYGDFPDIADGIDRKINAFRDTFSASRLIALSQSQDGMDAKLCVVPGYTSCFLIESQTNTC